MYKLYSNSKAYKAYKAYNYQYLNTHLINLAPKLPNTHTHIRSICTKQTVIVTVRHGVVPVENLSSIRGEDVRDIQELNVKSYF